MLHLENPRVNLRQTLEGCPAEPWMGTFVEIGGITPVPTQNQDQTNGGGWIYWEWLRWRRYESCHLYGVLYVGGGYEVFNYRITVDFFENYRNTLLKFLCK